jgi:hypothetical protein
LKSFIPTTKMFFLRMTPSLWKAIFAAVMDDALAAQLPEKDWPQTA